jgi:hypothetical protein
MTGDAPSAAPRQRAGDDGDDDHEQRAGHERAPARRQRRGKQAGHRGVVKAEMKQPSDSFVYLVSSGLGLAKIGVAPEPRQRLRELQVGSPVRLELALAEPYATREEARAVAEELGRRFADRRALGHW